MINLGDILICKKELRFKYVGRCLTQNQKYEVKRIDLYGGRKGLIRVLGVIDNLGDFLDFQEDVDDDIILNKWALSEFFYTEKELRCEKLKTISQLS